ncbi:MAG: hypothetical protein IPG35_09720 [Flavobacteriales bacterium]|nr:hypothetical protein [Flavobacteriales bacterium]
MPGVTATSAREYAPPPPPPPPVVPEEIEEPRPPPPQHSTTTWVTPAGGVKLPDELKVCATCAAAHKLGSSHAAIASSDRKDRSTGRVRSSKCSMGVRLFRSEQMS